MAKKKKTNNGYEGSNFQKWASSNTQSSKSTESTAVTTTPQKNSYQGSNFQKWATKTDEATQEKKQTEQIKSNSRSVINSISQWSKNVRNAKNANTRDQLSQQGQQYMNILKSNKDSISADVLNQATNVLATGQRYLTEQAKKSSWASDYNKAVANTDTDTHKIKFGSSSEGSTSSKLNNGTYKEDTDSTYKGLAKAIEQGKSATAETNAQDKLYQAALKATQQQEAVGKGLQTDAAKAEQLQGQQNRKLQQIQSRADYEANSQKDDSVKDEQYQWINAGKKIYTDDNDYLSTLTMVANLVPETSLIPGTTLKAKDMVNEARLGSLMTDEELKNYNYLYKTEGSDSATNYLDSIKSDLQSRYRQDTESRMAQYSEDAPVAAWLTERVLNTYVEPLSYVSNLETKLKGEDLDPNGFSQSVIYGGNAITNQQVDSINSDFGKFLYQTGSSMADFAASLLATGGASALTSGVKGAASGVKAGASALKAGQGIKAAASAAKTAGSAATVANAAKSTASAAKAAQNASLAIMGTTAAAETIQDAKDRGLTDAQALTLGTISGLAEVATEKVSIDTLLDKVPSLGKNLPGYIAKNVLAEGSEEGASDVINLFADILVSKDKSEWQTSINEYVNAGYTEEEAFGLAVKDQAAQVLQDMAGGALSGGIFAGATGGLNAMANHTMNMQTAAEEGTAGAAIESGLESPKDSRSYKLAENLQKKIENGETVTQKQVAALLSANEKQINYEDAVAAQEDEAERKAQGYSVKQWENKKKIEKALSQTTEQMQTAQAEAQQASGLSNEQWAIRNRITNGQKAVNPVYNNFTTSSRTRALDAIGAPSMNSNYKMSNSRGYISSENKTTAQAASDNYTVGRIAQNFSTSGMTQTAKAVENGYKADMNPTVYMQAVQAAFETGYLKKPISKMQGIDYYMQYIPMPALESIYNAALTDRFNKDKAYKNTIKHNNISSTIAVSENGENNGRKSSTNDEFGRIQEESRRKSNGKSWGNRSGRLDEYLSRRLSRTLRDELRNRGYGNSNLDGILNLSDGKGDFFILYKDVDAETFHDFFEISRGYTENGELVDLHPVETTEEEIGYEDCKCFLSDDGRQGFAITNQNDLISVFNSDCRHRGFLRSIKKVINDNAKTLDCYASTKQNLPEIYSGIFGWKTASLMDYNMKFDHDNIAKNHGMPPVAFMVNTDKQVTEKYFTKDQYDEAVKYRNSFVENNEENNNEREIRISEERGRETVQDTGRQSGSVAEETGRTESGRESDRHEGTEQKVSGSVQTAEEKNGRVTAKSLGIEGGTDEASAKIVNVSDYDESTKALYDELKDFGLEVVAFEGSLSIDGVGNIRGAVSGNKIYVKTNASNYDAYQIGKHEFFHSYISETAKSKGRSRESIVYGYWNKVVELYDDEADFENYALETYRELYDGTGYSDAQLIEEMLCDMFAGMNELSNTSVEAFSFNQQERFYNLAEKLVNTTNEMLNNEVIESDFRVTNEDSSQYSKDFDKKEYKIQKEWAATNFESFRRLVQQRDNLQKNLKKLYKANQKNKERAEHFKAETRRTPKEIIKNPFSDDSVIKDAAKHIAEGLHLDAYYTISDIEDDLRLATRELTDEEMRNMKERNYDPMDHLIGRIIDASYEEVENDLYSYYKDLLSGNTKILVTEADKRTFGGKEDWNAFRKSMMGTFTFVNYENRSKYQDANYTIDSLMDEIRHPGDMYTEMPIDLPQFATTSDMLHFLADLKENCFDRVNRLKEMGMEGWNIVEEMVYNELNDAVTRRLDRLTFADKAALRLEKTKAEDKAKLKNAVAKEKAKGIARLEKNEAKIREQYEKKLAKQAERSEKLQQEAKEKLEAAVKKEEKKREQALQNVIDHYKEVADNKKARKEASEDRQKLLNVARRLERMKTTSANRALIASAIGDLDTVSVGITGKTIEKLEGIKEYYDHKMDPNHAEYDPDFIASNGVLKAIDRLSKKRISEMDLEDVKDLTIILRNLEANIRNEKKLIDSEDKRETWQMGQEIVEDIQSSKGVKAGIRTKLDDVFVKGSLTADRAIRRMTGYIENDPLYKATKALDRGQWNMYKFQMESTKPFEKFINDKKFTKKIAGKNAETVKIKGTGKGNVPVEVEITRDQLMSLYMHSFNNDNLRHIKEGGLRVPDIKLFKKGDIKEAFARGTLIRLTPSQVRHYASQLTAQEKAFCEAARDYFSGTSQNAINEVSEKLMGYSLATVDNYFPINTASDFTKSDFESIVYNASIEGMGFLKERMEGAANAINLLDMSKVLQTSIEGTSKYVGYAIPVRNFKKLLHVSTGFFDDENRWHADDNIMTAIGEKWGNRGRTYIETLLSDIEGGTARENQDNVFNRGLRKLQSNYAGAVINMNLSVAIKQASGYPAAISTLGHKAVLKGLNVTKKVDDKLIEKYSPLLWTRMQGYSTPELGMIHDEGGVFDKLLTNNKWLNWISAADIATVRTMWRASEYYVKDNNKNVIPGTDPYYKAVAEIFEKAVEETQPNYTTMQRPELLRTNNALVSSIMMFKSQSFQNFNVLYDAFNNLSAKRAQFKAGVCTADELKMAKKQLSWAISGQFWQALIFTTLGIVWNFLRGREDKYKDEEGNLSPELMLSELGKEMISNTAGIIPFGEEAWDVISSAVFGDTYYGMDPAAISMINDIVDTGLNIVKDVQALADADEDFDWHNERLKLSEYLGDISKAFGVPYENIEKAVKIGLLWGMRTFGGDEGDWEYTTLFTRTDKSSGTTALFDKLFEAYESDEELYNQMREDLVKLGYTEEQIDKKMLKYITGGETKAAYDDMYGKIAEGKAEEAQELYDKLISVGVSEDSITSGLKKAFVRDIANDPEIESSDYAYEYLYSLYKSDYKSFKETYELMIDVGFTAKGIKSGVETLMKTEQGVDNVSKLKSRFKAPTTKSEQALKTSSTASLSSKSSSSSSTNESISTPESSYIASASYNGGKLTVKFQSGKTYTYNNVPEDVWEGFKDADSKGTYYSKKIKGKY